MSYTLNKDKFLSELELKNLNDSLSRYQFKDTKECLSILLSLHTGARACELLNIKVDDITTKSGATYIYIRGAKGSTDRNIPIKKPIAKLLHNYIAHAEKNTGDKLFEFSYQTLRRIWLHYRTAEKGFHSLRHTFAISIYKKTKDLRLVQVALGHKNIVNTMIYSQYVFNDQEMQRLIA